jgi:hypothetical protein
LVLIVEALLAPPSILTRFERVPALRFRPHGSANRSNDDKRKGKLAHLRCLLRIGATKIWHPFLPIHYPNKSHINSSST